MQNQYALTFFPTVTWVKRQHTFHFGADYRLMQAATPLSSSNSLSLVADGNFTLQCTTCGANNYQGTSLQGQQGNSIASLLMGTLSGGNVGIGVTQFWSYWYMAPFVQDDWRVSRKLTLNLGVRYDLQTAKRERHNRANYEWDMTTVNPVDGMLKSHVLPNGMIIPTIKGGMTFLGVDGNPTRNFSLALGDIQPRVGVSYALTDRIVIRGGFGETFQATDDQYPIMSGFNVTTGVFQNGNTNDGFNTPFGDGVAASGGASTGAHTGASTMLSDPWSRQQPLLPMGSSQRLTTLLGSGQSYQNSKYRNSNMWNWSFGFQHQLSNHDMIDVSYVGNKQPNRYESQNINHVDGNIAAKCNYAIGGNRHLCDDNYWQNPAAIYGYMGNPYCSGSGCNSANNMYSTSYSSATTPGVPAGLVQTNTGNLDPSSNPYVANYNPFTGQNWATAPTTPNQEMMMFSRHFPMTWDLTQWGWQGKNDLPFQAGDGRDEKPRAWYNSLQFTGEHRTTWGLTLHGTATWSKLMNAGTYTDNTYLVRLREVDQNDLPLIINIAGTYALPFGRGQRFLGNSNRIVDLFVGGWTIAPVQVWSSGVPMTVRNGGTVSGYDLVRSPKIKRFNVPGTGAWYTNTANPTQSGYKVNIGTAASPNWVASPNDPQYAKNRYLYEPCFWNVNNETGIYTATDQTKAYMAAFPGSCNAGPVFLQVPGTYGVNHNNIYSGIRQEKYRNLDSNLAKKIRITEKSQLELRLETFNTLNHPTWNDNPWGSGSTQQGQMGRASSGGGGQNNRPREMLLVGKYTW